MGSISKIEWTNASWNPITGCSYISEGCSNCYAKRMALRLKSMGIPRYRQGFNVSLHYDLLNEPLRWKTPRMIFVNSMSDLFHEDVPLSFIKRVLSTIEAAHGHIFQVLTKRADRLAELAQVLAWPKNMWVGVSVESNKQAYRINSLKMVPCLVKFISFEPLLGPMADLDLESISWVIVGGESGPHSRRMSPEWARSIRDKCLELSIPFFFKQWGGTRKAKNGRLLDGKIWSEYPVQLGVPRSAFDTKIKREPDATEKIYRDSSV